MTHAETFSHVLFNHCNGQKVELKKRRPSLVTPESPQDIGGQAFLAYLLKYNKTRQKRARLKNRVYRPRNRSMGTFKVNKHEQRTLYSAYLYDLISISPLASNRKQ